MRLLLRGGIAAMLAVVLAAAGGAGSVRAAGNELRVEPPVMAVDEGATFTVSVVLNATDPTSGAQATVTFDPALLQVTSVTRGAPFEAAPFFVAGDEAAIAAANASGRLATVAVAFVPPGSVPPGDAEFLRIGFKAIACGESELGLPVGPADASLLDARDGVYGELLEVTATGGTVTICGGQGTVPGAAAPAATPPTTAATPPTTGEIAPVSADTGPPWVAIGLVGLLIALVVGGGLWLMRRRPA